MSELSSVKVSISPSEKFREYLATKGKRLTQERQTIVDEVFSSHEHFDAEQLTERLGNREDGKRVSRATVYRALTDMRNAGLLRKVARTNDRDVWEHDYGYPKHDHLICTECGSLTEFHNTDFSQIIQKIADDNHFRMSGHRLEVYGLCDNCSQPPKSRPSKLDLL